MSGIRLIPFGELDAALLVNLTDTLSLKFNAAVAWGEQLEAPESGFDAERSQSLAGAFLNELHALPEKNGIKLLGVTETDLYSTGLNFVFGQAEVGGTAAVISLARLYPADTDGGGADLLRERTLKEAVHELGHTYGLDHCRDRYCVMHFSTGITETDVKSDEFCPRHASELTVGRF